MATETIGENTGNTYTGVTDACFKENNPTNPFGLATTFEINKYGSGDHANGAIKFSGLSKIVGPVTVTAATLYLWNTPAVGATSTISAFRLLRNWVETEVTWNVFSSGNNWTTGGGLGAATDRVAAASGSGVIGSASGQYFPITGLAADVEAWINGTANNYGWLLERTDGANDSTYQVFTSSQSTDDFQRPYLEVTYTAGGGGGGGGNPWYYYANEQLVRES